MNNINLNLKTNPTRKSFLKSFLICIPMILLTGLLTTNGFQLPSNKVESTSMVATFILLNIVFFLMIYTGKTDKYRSIIFIASAFCFTIGFIPNMLEMRGSTTIDTASQFQGLTPFCHMVIPMVLVPAAISKTIIFPGTLLGSHYSILSMVIIWIGVSLALGRGWCSWGCFYGGWDDCFSRIRRKTSIKKIDPKWRYLPYAVLVTVVLTSAILIEPTYCTWICPFKAVSEFEPVTSFKVAVQTAIFVSLFLGLAIILPILTKKRTQCSLLCPFGAFQSFTNKINVYDIRIDKEKCVNCKKCANICPTLSMDEESIKKGCALLTCTKCGKCIDECPKKAISYHIKGTTVGHKCGRSRLLFIYTSFLFLSVMGGGMISSAIYRILLLITTGHITN